MRRVAFVLLLLAPAALGCGGSAATGVAAAAPRTFVTLQFDDGVHQDGVGALLARHGLHATFFVNTATLGRPATLSWDDLTALTAQGNEIGGHTLTHPDLTTLPAAGQRREICDDRSSLVAHGLDAVSFAYPYGRQTATTRRIVRDCGYTSGRLASGLRGAGCARCPYALDLAHLGSRFTLRTARAPTADTSEAAVRAVVRGAIAHGGGWVQIFWHRICAGRCHRYSWPPSRLDRFLGWLRAQSDAGRVRVRTTAQVVRSLG